jgi:hypothetical protein
VAVLARLCVGPALITKWIETDESFLEDGPDAL